jgi:hypothetical protein
MVLEFRLYAGLAQLAAEEAFNLRDSVGHVGADLRRGLLAEVALIADERHQGPAVEGTPTKGTAAGRMFGLSQQRSGTLMMQQLVNCSKAAQCALSTDAAWLPLRHKARTSVAATLTE